MKQEAGKQTIHYCAGNHCPGLTWRASDRAHPVACATGVGDTRQNASVLKLDVITDGSADDPIPYALTDKARAALDEPGRRNVGDTLRAAANIAMHYDAPELASLILALANRIATTDGEAAE